MGFIKKWWKPLLILAITIVGIVLALIFLGDIGDSISWLIGGSGAAGTGETIRRALRRERDINYTATVTRDSVNQVPDNRDVETGKPDERGYVQLELDPSQDDLEEDEVPEGVKPDEVNTRTTINTDPKPDNATENHFDSRLSRRRRNDEH